jgi:hypothetical protein
MIFFALTMVYSKIGFVGSGMSSARFVRLNLKRSTAIP